MARSKSTSHVPMKPLVYAVLALVGGITLLILSQLVKYSAAPPSATATAPATAPASEPQEDQPTRSRKEATAQSLSGLLLLFGAAGFVVCVVCIGWFVLEVRKARPAWKKQQKYPQMRKK